MQFTDKVQIAGTRIREDGYLVVDARVARTGIQRYLGSEVGRPELNTVDVYRPEAEVFNSDAMASFAHRPVTDDHPKEAVTADNWKALSVGVTDGEVKRDGDYLRVPMMVADAAVIKKVQDGKRELSAGYSCELVWGDGITPDGKPYQAQQTNIRSNHVAIVDRARGGSNLRIGDGAGKWGAAPITAHDKETSMTTRNIMVDGLSVETTDQGAQAIEKLLKDRTGLQAQLDGLKTAHEEELKKKDADIAKKDAALDDAKAKVLDSKGLAKLVADRVALEATALKVAKDVKPAGLTDGELKLAVVKAALGDSIPAEKLADQNYVDARFDILAEDANKATDKFRDTMRHGRPAVHLDANMTDAQRARQEAYDALLHYDQTGQELKVN